MGVFGTFYKSKTSFLPCQDFFSVILFINFRTGNPFNIKIPPIFESNVYIQSEGAAQLRRAAGEEVNIMATSTLSNSRLSLEFDAGIDGKGNTIYARKSFNNVKPQATDDQLYEIVQALVPLQQHELSMIERNNTSVISA